MFLGYIDPGSGFTIFSLWGWAAAFLFGSLSIFLVYFKKIFTFFRKHGKISILVLIITLGLITIGIIMNRNQAAFDKKVIILGFDGLSPRIIEPMMEEGKLPNFSRLKDAGSYRHITTTNPPQSPVAWAAFSTGQNPGKNGIYDFITRDPRTYGLSLSLSNIEKGMPKRVIKAGCLWQYTSEAKVPTIMIAAPLTFPPYKIYGRMLSGMGVPDILGTEGTFTFYTTEYLNNIRDTGGKVFNIKRSPDMILNFIGPRLKAFGGKAENLRVPFRVILKGRDKADIEYQNNRFELEAGKWSGWKEVTFKLGLFRKMKGIFKFYLLETEPEFKLYISPINFDPRDPFFKISYPAAYSRTLADHIGLYHTQGMPVDTWAVNEKRLTEGPLLEEVREILRERKAMLDFEITRFEKGVLFAYFGTPDIIQHIFWRYRDPEHPLYEKDAPQEYKEMIEAWYKKMDGILGDVLRVIGREDTLIVLSDHGFGTFRRAAHINSWLMENGYLKLKNPHAESGAELLADVDWSNTKAYAIGFGAIYINQKGRERDGIVRKGEETELLKEEISAKLKKWVDQKYNSPVIKNVYRREDIFRGPLAGQTPDLYAGFNTGYRASWQTALGAVPKGTIEDNLKKWSGDHLFDPGLMPGVLFSNRPIKREDPSIYDIVPTVLKVIGISDEKLNRLDLDGEPLF